MPKIGHCPFDYDAVCCLPCHPCFAVNKAQALQAFGGKRPALGTNVFVAPNSSVVGDVKLGSGSSVWYGAVVRGGCCKTRLGCRLRGGAGDTHWRKVQGTRCNKSPAWSVTGRGSFGMQGASDDASVSWC